MVTFFSIDELDLAQDMVADRKIDYPTTRLKVIPISGFKAKNLLPGRGSKEHGGYVVAMKTAHYYESKHYEGFGTTPAARRDFESL